MIGPLGARKDPVGALKGTLGALKGPLGTQQGSPWPLGGVHNHSPGKSLLREIMQNGYKTCVILTFIVFFVKYVIFR